MQGSAWRTDEWRSQQKHDRMMFSIVQKKKNKKINEIQRERKWNENADHRSHVNYGFNQTQSLLPILLCLTYCPEQYDWQLNSCFRCVCLEWRMFHREPLTRRQFVTCTYTVNSLKWITFPYGTEREKKMCTILLNQLHMILYSIGPRFHVDVYVETHRTKSRRFRPSKPIDKLRHSRQTTRWINTFL